jgi:hypothetical protein
VLLAVMFVVVVPFGSSSRSMGPGHVTVLDVRSGKERWTVATGAPGMMLGVTGSDAAVVLEPSVAALGRFLGLRSSWPGTEAACCRRAM